MNSKTPLAIIVVVALGAATLAFAQTYGGPMGPGMMGGPGYGQGYGPGYGQMGPGYGQGYGYGHMGPGYGMGPGMMGGYGPGYMMRRGYGMGPGYGRGPGMMWGGGYQRWSDTDRNLSVDDVKRNFERWLAFHGNDRLKLGEVVQKDDSTIEVSIVTKKENAVVQKFSIDRRTGYRRPVGG